MSIPIQYIVLGAHFEGANDSQVFTDVKHHAYTSSNPRIKTAEYAPITGSTASAYFDGTGGISYDILTDFDVDGIEEFTIGFWVKSNTNQAGNTILLKQDKSDNSKYHNIFATVDANNISFTYNNGGGGLVTTGVYPKTSWHYVQIVRTYEAPNGVTRMWIDGQQDPAGNLQGGSFTPDIGLPLFVGSYKNIAGHWIGYIDDLFLLKGYAMDGSFVPTAQFPNPEFWTAYVKTTERIYA